MKELKSKEDNKKTQKRNQAILGIALVFVMLMSTFGIITESFGNGASSGKIEYNGFTFTQNNEFWNTQTNNQNLIFRYNPLEINKLDLEINSLNNYYGKPLYIESKNFESSSEIYNNLNPIAQRIQLACFEKDSCEAGIPVKTCDDNFIIIRENEMENISQIKNCVFIEGPGENLTETTDAFLFKLFEIEQ